MCKGAKARGVAWAGEGHVSWALSLDHCKDKGTYPPKGTENLAPVQVQGLCSYFFTNTQNKQLKTSVY